MEARLPELTQFIDELAQKMFKPMQKEAVGKTAKLNRRTVIPNWISGPAALREEKRDYQGTGKDTVQHEISLWSKKYE